MQPSERIGVLSAKLKNAYESLDLANSDLWRETWAGLEAAYLDRLMGCGPTDDEERYRCQIAIEVVRNVRRTIEHEGHTIEGLEKELAILEGRKLRPIA